MPMVPLVSIRVASRKHFSYGVEDGVTGEMFEGGDGVSEIESLPGLGQLTEGDELDSGQVGKDEDVDALTSCGIYLPRL